MNQIVRPILRRARVKPFSLTMQVRAVLLSGVFLLTGYSQATIAKDYVVEVATYTVIEQDTQGYIKIYADQLLFANIDLDFNGFRMIEKRRLKLNERHFFDHPKFGILMQVSRLPKTPETPSLAESQ